LRISVRANLGLREFARFHVDLVTGVSMTGEPDEVDPLVRTQIPGLTPTVYRAYPLVDHIADKVCALLETHTRASGLQEPSSRYRDLVDVCLLAHAITVTAVELHTALVSEGARRGLVLPERIGVPSGANWRSGYERIAQDAPSLREHNLQSALATAGRFIDPVLAGVAQGHWDYEELRWTAA
jgi:hypothetical protein